MKILLANSYYLEQDANEQKIMKPYPPLGILYLSATLKKGGHDIQVFDSTFMTFSGFRDHLDSFRPDLVGIYSNIITRKIALAMVGEARDRNYPVVVGGPDPTGEPQPYLDAGALAVVRGEGERTMTALATHLEKDGFNGRLGDMPGIWVSDNGGALMTGQRERIDDLDELPFPDREELDLE